MSTAQPPAAASDRFQRPGWFTRNVFNKAIAGLTGLGISVWGSRVLEVKGRKSGQWRSTPVNLLEVDGDQYLVAPRGNTQWVRNMRAAGGGRLRLGRKTEDFKAIEVPPEAGVPILRAYLKRWKMEVGVFFDGVGPDSTDAELAAIAPKRRCRGRFCEGLKRPRNQSLRKSNIESLTMVGSPGAARSAASWASSRDSNRISPHAPRQPAVSRLR